MILMYVKQRKYIQCSYKISAKVKQQLIHYKKRIINNNNNKVHYWVPVHLFRQKLWVSQFKLDINMYS